jgi:lysophospholipase L1-like esterase
MTARLVIASLFALVLSIASAAGAASEVRPLRIMCIGDSITEGGATFANYRPLLAAQLAAAGRTVEFVGSRTSPSDLGPLRHEGYGGKNIEFLAQTVPAHFAATPADVVLLNAGHNHFDTEKPVPGMIAATAELIGALRKANPKVTVLLAQVITAGKLPKYSYIPELNTALAQLAAKLSTPAQPVILVDHATGFDWRTDTITDLVHPNAAGAAKMAQRWFTALQTLPRSP